jgi:hypothetical protein
MAGLVPAIADFDLVEGWMSRHKAVHDKGAE